MSSAYLSEGDDPQDGMDLLAAGWVLGTLDATEQARAARLLGTDMDFAGLVTAWERRLAPLARLAPPADPPDALWSRIASRLSAPTPPDVIPIRPPARSMRNSAKPWQAATAASLALAACLAGFIVIRGIERPATLAQLRPAVLLPPGGAAAFVVDVSDAGLRVRPSGTIAVADGQDLELWALREGATRPESLGVLPSTGRLVATVLPAGTQLLVSLEPRGGSPTGQPTGPVVYAGRLAGTG